MPCIVYNNRQLDTPSVAYAERRLVFRHDYLSLITSAEGRHVIYYASSDRPEGPSYYAVARVGPVHDAPHPEHFMSAWVFDYCKLETPVMASGGGVFESALSGENRYSNRQRAIRPIPDHEVLGILSHHPRNNLATTSHVGHGSTGFEEEMPADFEGPPVLGDPVSRLRQDLRLRLKGREAYARCALSGRSPSGTQEEPELEPAFLKPLALGGSCAIENAIFVIPALLKPVTQGLITLTDDFRIIAKPDLDPIYRSHLRATALLPENSPLQPRREFIRYHRSKVFK